MVGSRHRLAVVLAVCLQWVGTPDCSAQGIVPEELVVLQFPSTLRTAGFNGAGVALVGNAGAVFYNPAGLATIRHMAVEGALQAGPFSGEHSTAAIAWRLHQFDLGFGLSYFD